MLLHLLNGKKYWRCKCKPARPKSLALIGNGRRDISRVLRRRTEPYRLAIFLAISAGKPIPNLILIRSRSSSLPDNIMVYQAESAAQRGQIPSLAARRRLAKMAELSIQTAGGGGDTEYWQQQLQPARVEETDKDNKDGYSSPNCTTPPPLNFD